VARPAAQRLATPPASRSKLPQLHKPGTATTPVARSKHAASQREAKRSVGTSRSRFVPEPVRVVKIKSLDPVARCGMGTSVEQLYRVDEQIDGRFTTVHLVFFDKYAAEPKEVLTGKAPPQHRPVADVHQDLRAQRRSVPRLATTTRAAGR